MAAICTFLSTQTGTEGIRKEHFGVVDGDKCFKVQVWPNNAELIKVCKGSSLCEDGSISFSDETDYPITNFDMLTRGTIIAMAIKFKNFRTAGAPSLCKLWSSKDVHL